MLSLYALALAYALLYCKNVHVDVLPHIVIWRERERERFLTLFEFVRKRANKHHEQN